MADKIKVRIRAQEMVTYSQVVEMDREAFEEIQELLGDENARDSDISCAVEDYLDRSDVSDGSGLEDVEVEIFRG